MKPEMILADTEKYNRQITKDHSMLFMTWLRRLNGRSCGKMLERSRGQPFIVFWGKVALMFYFLSFVFVRKLL